MLENAPTAHGLQTIGPVHQAPQLKALDASLFTHFLPCSYPVPLYTPAFPGPKGYPLQARLSAEGCLYDCTHRNHLPRPESLLPWTLPLSRLLFRCGSSTPA